MPTIGAASILSATDGASTIDCFDSATVGFDITTDGSWNGTLSFEGSSNGTNFRSINAFNVGAGTFSRTYTTASEGTTWVVPCGGFQKLRVRASTYAAGTATVTPTAANQAEWGVQMYPWLTTEGATAASYGANPTAVAAAARANLFCNRAGILHILGGHPGLITRRDNYTSAQTDTALVTVSSGTKIVVTRMVFACDKANTVNVAARAGFGAANTPTGAGVLISHPGIDAGGGISQGSGVGILGVGADGEDLRLTCGAPTTGSIDVVTTYFTIES